MDGALFADSAFGSAARRPGDPFAFTYYLPRPIPRRIDLTSTVVAALSEADAALGLLNGLGTLVSEPGLLIGPYARREALASSRIEGTQASLSEVFQSEIDTEAATMDTDEVRRNLEATEQAYALAKTLPITQRLVLEVHATLLSGVRGEEKSPGEFRRSPVWIGAAGATPETAAFVPPLPEHLGELLRDWEHFVNEDGRDLPPLVHAALMHYQFETIHPFLDGNGRIGRLLINLLLVERGRLPLPLLYLSNYFETHREQYYRGLQQVREQAAIADWLSFFLEAVRAQADDAVRRARALVALREEYRRVALQERSKLPRLVEIMMRNPFLTVTSVAMELAVTDQGARNLVKNAERRGWLRSIGSFGRGGRERWFAPAVFSIIDSPMTYSEVGA